MTTKAVGTVDHPNRWSNALTTRTAATERMVPAMMTFCSGLVSANGPAFMRRCSASGIFTAR